MKALNCLIILINYSWVLSPPVAQILITQNVNVSNKTGPVKINRLDGKSWRKQDNCLFVAKRKGVERERQFLLNPWICSKDTCQSHRCVSTATGMNG